MTRSTIHSLTDINFRRWSIGDLKLTIQVKSFAVFAWTNPQSSKCFRGSKTGGIFRGCSGRRGCQLSKSVQFQVFFGGLANINRYLILLVDRVCFISDPDTDITSLIKGLEEETNSYGYKRRILIIMYASAFSWCVQISIFGRLGLHIKVCILITQCSDKTVSLPIWNRVK